MFLAGFSGLYFTVVAITDDLYRKEFFSAVMDELARAVGVRVVYRELRRRQYDGAAKATGLSVTGAADGGGRTRPGGRRCGTARRRWSG